MAPAPGISIRGLAKAFGTVTAVDGLDLDVADGSIVGLLGRSGAGKSTTLRLIAGLARPTSGSVSFASGARPSVGHLAQEPGFYDWMTGRELLAFVADIGSAERAEGQAQVDGALAGLALDAIADRRISTYTNDERARLGIAQACVGRPQVVLLDEPFAALDPDGRADAVALLGELRGDATIMLASRTAAGLEGLCDRVAVLDHGRLIADARVDALVGGATDSAYIIEMQPGTGLALAGLVARLRAEPWVRAATAEQTVLRVSIRDHAWAARDLLPMVVATGLSISVYRRERPTLDDALAQLLDGRNGAAERAATDAATEPAPDAVPVP